MSEKVYVFIVIVLFPSTIHGSKLVSSNHWKLLIRTLIKADLRKWKQTRERIWGQHIDACR